MGRFRYRPVREVLHLTVSDLAKAAPPSATLTITVTGTNDAQLTPNVTLTTRQQRRRSITPVDISGFEDVDNGDTLTFTADGLPRA